MAKQFNFHITYREGGCMDVPVDNPPDTFRWRVDRDMNCLILRWAPERRDYYPLADVFKFTFTIEEVDG